MDQAFDIRLTPAGHLALNRVDEQVATSSDHPCVVFTQDWRAGLFALAAENINIGNSLASAYWRRVAEHYLTALCHLPGTGDEVQVEPPSQAQFAQWVLSAPPMMGGEYLSVSTLEHIWDGVASWVREQVKHTGNLETFLATHAPKWRQVGRVCFHLAENKNDAVHPFAFLATYSTGFGVGGKLKHLPLGQAMEQYAGAENRHALVKLLTPVHESTKRCHWVADLVSSRQVYQPQAWSSQKAYVFLRSVPALEASGLAVRVPDWWKKRPRPQVSVTIGSPGQSHLGVDALLSFNVQIALEDQVLSKKEIEQLLAGEEGLVLAKGQWVEMDRARLQEALAHWEAVQRQAGHDGISFIEGMRLLAGASADLKHEDDAPQQCQWISIKPDEELRNVLASLRDPTNLPGIHPDQGLNATLRPYQIQGVAWLDFLGRLGLGACLADDMGLGKTLQVLAMLLNEKHRLPPDKRRPSLLIVPASLLGNWHQEARRFTPSLVLEMIHPAETTRERLDDIACDPDRALADVDLVVTTYAMLARQVWLNQFHWRRVILDEAQAIKNPSSNQSKMVKKLKASTRIALTGTPVENRLGDLWSLFDFLNPGLLGSASVFKSFIKRLQNRQDDQFASLRQLVSPYILRRLKTDRSIITDLPEKTEAVRYCTLTKSQAMQYEQVVRAMESTLKNVGNAIARRGLVLQTLMRLKQICNHPSQFTGDGDYTPTQSGKFTRISELGEELAQRQEKVLVFTQFREIIPPLAEHLAKVFGRAGLALHGGTSVKQRHEIVGQFQREQGPPFMILSLKAGGTGLNLTAASHVIHFDRWWNPAVENQATDRAFRIGQKRNVLVHKFITRGTVEERIDKIIADKHGMAQQLLSAGEDELNLTELTDDALFDLIRLDMSQAMAV